VEDTAASVGWLHETAAANDSRIDGVALLGASAGAVTVLNLAYVIDDLGIPRPAIAAVVALWGAMGLVYDPTLSVMSVDEAPVILVHGTADTVVDYETGSLRIANRAAQIGLPYELIANVGAGHSFSEMDLFVLETMPGSGVTQAQRIIDFIGVALLASDCLRQQGVIDACVLPDPQASVLRAIEHQSRARPALTAPSRTSARCARLSTDCGRGPLLIRHEPDRIQRRPDLGVGHEVFPHEPGAVILDHHRDGRLGPSPPAARRWSLAIWPDATSARRMSPRRIISTSSTTRPCSRRSTRSAPRARRPR
jgi:hypothetical protein